jgi:hypothetical protein
VERTHPVFYSLGEQWESWVQAIQDLKTRQAFLRHPNGKIIQFRTLSVPDPAVNRERLTEVEQHYLQTSFRSQAEVARELESYRRAEFSPIITRARLIRGS